MTAEPLAVRLFKVDQRRRLGDRYRSAKGLRG